MLEALRICWNKQLLTQGCRGENNSIATLLKKQPVSESNPEALRHSSER